MQEQVEVPDMRSPQIPDLEMLNEIQNEIPESRINSI